MTIAGTNGYGFLVDVCCFNSGLVSETENAFHRVIVEPRGDAFLAHEICVYANVKNRDRIMKVLVTCMVVTIATARRAAASLCTWVTPYPC